MNQSIVERQPAYLLHTYPYRDSSALLEIWSLDFGRVGLVARGARRAKSPWRGLLDSFQPMLVSWGGNGELKTLRGLESQNLLTVPAGEALAAAYYVNELILRTCMRDDAHPRLYAAYGRMLELLSAAQPFEAQLRYFEKQLLTELGYGLDLVSDWHGGPLLPTAEYRYVADQGAIPVTQVNESFGEKLSGEVLLALEQERLGESQLTDAKRLMRALLKPHLGSRPLESRRLWTIFSKLRKGQ